MSGKGMKRLKMTPARAAQLGKKFETYLFKQAARVSSAEAYFSDHSNSGGTFILCAVCDGGDMCSNTPMIGAFPSLSEALSYSSKLITLSNKVPDSDSESADLEGESVDTTPSEADAERANMIHEGLIVRWVKGFDTCETVADYFTGMENSGWDLEKHYADKKDEYPFPVYRHLTVSDFSSPGEDGSDSDGSSSL